MFFFASSNTLANYPIKAAIQLIASHSFPGVEIWSEHLWNDDISPRELKKQLDQNNLQRSLHAPTRDINITSTNSGIRQESIRQVMESLEVAAEIGASTVVVHPGRMSSTKDSRDDFARLQVEALYAICRRAQQLGLVVGVENMEFRAKELVIDSSSVNQLVREVGLDSCGVTFDIAHAITYCYHRNKNPEMVIKQASDYLWELKRVIHVHISNTDLVSTHLPLSEGRFDLTPILIRLSQFYKGPIAIEGYKPGYELSVLRDNSKAASDLLDKVKKGG